MSGYGIGPKGYISSADEMVIPQAPSGPGPGAFANAITCCPHGMQHHYCPVCTVTLSTTSHRPDTTPPSQGVTAMHTDAAIWGILLGVLLIALKVYDVIH